MFMAGYSTQLHDHICWMLINCTALWPIKHVESDSFNKRGHSDFATLIGPHQRALS